MLDVKRLIGEVAAQNGIRLEPDDPAFALVTLNQLVLEETANRVFEQISAALVQFSEGLSKGEQLAGKTLAQEVRVAAIEARKEWAAGVREMQPASMAHVPGARLGQFLWWAVGALSGIALTAAGIGLYRVMAGC
jgi:hypothetical protein